MQIDGKIWEIAGIPFSWSAENVEEVTFNVWNWDTTVVRSKRQGKTRTWYVRAAEAPSREFYQLEDGLAVVQEAGPRPAVAPAQRQRWAPGGDLHSDVHWPQAWTDPNRTKTLREKASPAFGGRMVAKPDLPMPGPARPAASPGPPSSNDLTAIIQAAVQAAMAPHVKAFVNFQNEVQGLLDDNDSNAESGSAAKRPRRRRQR